MPHVVVLATGGTISSRSTARAVVAVDEASVLLTGLKLGDGLTVEAHDVLCVGSYRLSLADMRAVAVEVSRQLHRDDVDGVVVTHGTDGIEETAISPIWSIPTPAVVLTGAQCRPTSSTATARVTSATRWPSAASRPRADSGC